MDGSLNVKYNHRHTGDHTHTLYTFFYLSVPMFEYTRLNSHILGHLFDCFFFDHGSG